MEKILMRKDPWSEERCQEAGFGVCRGEGKSLCKMKGLVYKHVCLLYKEVELKSVYYGQTSRSLGERAQEHDIDLKCKLSK